MGMQNLLIRVVIVILSLCTRHVMASTAEKPGHPTRRSLEFCTESLTTHKSPIPPIRSVGIPPLDLSGIVNANLTDKPKPDARLQAPQPSSNGKHSRNPSFGSTFQTDSTPDSLGVPLGVACGNGPRPRTYTMDDSLLVGSPRLSQSCCQQLWAALCCYKRCHPVDGSTEASDM